MNGGKEELINHAKKVLEDDQGRFQEYSDTGERVSQLLDENRVFRYDHPLHAELANLAPMSINQVTAMTEMIESFESDPTFQDDVRRRLNRPQQYPSARLELEIAYFSKESGVPVEFVDPKAEHGQRQPDLLVDGSLPLKIKQMNWPEHMVDQNEYVSEISNTVFQRSVTHHFRRAGSIRRPLSEPEKDEFIARIEEAVPRVRNGETVEIRETSLGEVVYEVFLAPHDREDELTEWMEEHDVDGALSGPNQTKNDVLRLTRSIAEKVKQIPPEAPGVVLIEVDPMISLDERANGLLGIAKEVLKDVYDHERFISEVLLVRANSLNAEPIEV